MPKKTKEAIKQWFTPAQRIQELDQSKLKEFMQSFTSEAPENPNFELIDYIQNHQTAFLDTLTPLYEMGLFDGNDATTSIEDFIELGKSIYIIEENGDIKTYTEKFLENDMTDELLSREKDAPNKHGMIGRVMLAQMSMILSGHPAAEGMLGKESTVIIAPPGKDILTLTSGKNIQALEEYGNLSDEQTRIKEAQKKAESEFKQKETAYRKSIAENEQKLKGKRPDTPVQPREKNGFRRFFCALGFPHSAKYKAQKTIYDREMEQIRKYDQSVKTVRENMNKLKQEFNQYQASYTAQANSMNEQLKTATAKRKECMEQNPDAFQKLPDSLDVVKQLEKEKADKKMKALVDKINSPKSVQAVLKSELMPFETGALESTVYIANNITKMSSAQFSRQVLESTFGAMGAAAASRSYQKSKDKQKKKNFTLNTQTEFQMRCDESKKLFEKVFGMPCNPENMTYVMDTLNIQSFIDKKISEDRTALHDNADVHAPTKIGYIDKHNIGIAAHILMSGIKSELLASMEKEAQTQKQKTASNERALDMPKPADVHNSREIPCLPEL